MSFWTGFATGSLLALVAIGAGYAGTTAGSGDKWLSSLIDEEEARWFSKKSRGKRFVLFNWLMTTGQFRQVLDASNSLSDLHNETWSLPKDSSVGIWDTRGHRVVFNRYV